MKFILASTSKYRKQLLERAGFDFESHAPLADEEALKKDGPKSVEEMTRFLALKKAESLLKTFPKVWIVGCDQAAMIRGQLINKPGSREKAIEQLRALQGRSHQLITSMAIVKNGQKPVVFTDITKIKLRPLSLKDIETYVDKDRPFDCAGGYKFEKSGIALIQTLKTKDPSAIEGLSLVDLTSFFVEQGFSLAEILKNS